MNEQEYEAVGRVKASKYRKGVLAHLSAGESIPTEIAEGTGYEMSHVSRCLTELRDYELVELKVPEAMKKGRIYGITEKGKAVAEEIDA